MKALAIAGTDTNVGKTILTTSLVAYWQKYCKNKSLGLMKLIQTGVGDSILYERLFACNPGIEIVTPISFPDPLAPPIAAFKAGQSIELGRVWQAFEKLEKQQDFTFLETLGGLGSPITNELTVADLTADWRLNVVLVVPIKLGAISQAVANVALARQSGIALKGIVLSCSQPLSEAEKNDLAPVELIASLTQIPVLGTIPYLEDCSDLDVLANVASNLDLEFILPFAVDKTPIAP